MHKLKLLILGSSALVSTAAFAQAPVPAQPQGNICQELLTFLERRGAAQPASPVTIDQARGFQTSNDVAGCRVSFERIRTAGIELPPNVVALIAVPAQGQPAAQPGQAREGTNIVVQQPAPTVRVEQASPQVTVQQAQPQVTVRQAQPEILVRQPAPTVTVDIPQPEITVRMPRPDVNVAMAQPQVEVNQPKPEVQVVQPAQPQVQVQPAQPQVTIQGPANPQANVQVQAAESQPQVRYERAEAKVVVNQPQGQPQVRVEQQPAQGGQQGQQQAAQTQAAASAGAAAGANAIAVSRLDRMNLYNAKGDELGDVEQVVQGADGKYHVVIGAGGFLGIGERKVPIPIERVAVRGDRLIIQGVTEDQIKQMPAFNNQGFKRLEGNATVPVAAMR